MTLKGNLVKANSNLVWKQSRASSFLFRDSLEVNINFQQNSIIIKKNA